MKTMPKEFYRTGSYNVDHTTFGGYIYPSDFNNDYSGKLNTNGSTIASRIASDWRFDNSCKKNNDNRIQNNNWIKSKNND